METNNQVLMGQYTAAENRLKTAQDQLKQYNTLTSAVLKAFIIFLILSVILIILSIFNWVFIILAVFSALLTVSLLLILPLMSWQCKKRRQDVQQYQTECDNLAAQLNGLNH